MVNKQSFLFLLPFMLLLPTATLGQKAFYIPKALLIPFHDQQQQLHTSFGIGGGYDINLSYAFTNHFAVFTTGTLNKGTKRRTSLFGDRYNIVKDDYAFKYGLGYFKATKGFFNVLETYAGYGTYKVDNYWYFSDDPNLGSTVTQAHQWNVFWQVNAGRKAEKLEYSIAGRVSYSKYNNILFYDTHPNVSYIKSRYENLKGITIEPAFCLGYKVKNVFINVQTGLAIPISKSKVTKIDTHTFPDTTIVVVSSTTEALNAVIARISLQYNFNFRKKGKADVAHNIGFKQNGR